MFMEPSEKLKELIKNFDVKIEPTLKDWKECAQLFNAGCFELQHEKIAEAKLLFDKFMGNPRSIFLQGEIPPKD